MKIEGGDYLLCEDQEPGQSRGRCDMVRTRKEQEVFVVKIAIPIDEKDDNLVSVLEGRYTI